MTTATNTKNEVTLIPTSTPNFFYALSSNGRDAYGLIYTGPGAAICSCVGCEVYHKNCRHRVALLARHTYQDPEITMRFVLLEASIKVTNEAIAQALANRIEDAAELADYEEMMAA